MTAEQAKRHLVRQDGEPSTGYIAAFDVASAIDQVYGDMELIVPPEAGTLDGLTDVEVPDPDVGQVLTWGGTSWGAESPEAVGVPLQVPPASGGNDTAMLQQALDDAATLVGSSRAVAVVRLWPGQTYSVNATLTLPSQVILDGVGSVISLASASNCDVIRSENFASLTRTNTWFVADGVPSGFGLIDLVIDGNKAGQSGLGNGVAIYGKHYLIRNVVIDDCKGNGLYSECASFAGAQADWRDVPEAHIDRLRTQYCDGHGVHFRGPHDSQFTALYTNGNGGDGYRSEVSIPPGDPDDTGDYYAGTADIGFLHAHRNDVGVRIGAFSSIRECSSESNAKEGMIINAGGVRVHGLMLYYNWIPEDPENPPALGHGYSSLVVNSGPCTFGNIRVTNAYGGTAIRVDGDQGTTFGAVSVDGVNSDGRGISIAGNNVRIGAASIRNYSGDGGVGLHLADNLHDVSVDAILGNNDIFLVLPGDGTGDRIRLNVDGYVAAGQVGMTGSLMNGRGNELSRHLQGPGTGLFHDSTTLHWSLSGTLAHDGTWFYVNLPIPSWVSSVATSRMVITAAVAAAASGLPAGQGLRVASISPGSDTVKVLWTHPFGAEPAGAATGQTVTVNYTVRFMDQGE